MEYAIAAYFIPVASAGSYKLKSVMPARHRIFLAMTTVALLNYMRAQNAPAAVDFTRDIQPILEKSCYSCHGDKLQMGRLRLDSKTAAMNGGQSGTLIHAGKSTESILYQRVA